MSLESVKSTVETGRLKKIESVVQEAIEEGIAAIDILNTMIGVMSDIGEKFQKDEIYVPEMMASALAMKKGVSTLKPYLGNAGNIFRGKFIIGTVQGDLHDIGKNLVALMIESAGFEVIDLGVDVSADKFVEAIKANPDCKLVGLSSLLTTTMEAMRNTSKAIIDAGLKGQVKIMVGGAPITSEFAAEIGADAYTPDAGSAANKAKELVA